jgi:DNA-3-methyladenine glycosylase II
VDEISFQVAPHPPFRLDLTAWALRRRPDNAIDRWDGRAYRRTLALGDAPAELTVVEQGGTDGRLAVTLQGPRLGPSGEPTVRAALARLLGVDLDLSGFYRLADGDRFLRPLAERFRGLKPPRLPSLFEALVNAIACQQLTLTVGIRLLNRLAELHGESIGGGPHGFPRPARLATIPPETLRSLGFSGAKARSIVAVAAGIEQGELDEGAVEGLDDAPALAKLQRLRGIGRWSAEYALLRGLGRLHVFPGDDVGARNNLARRLGIEGPLDYAAVREAVTPWQPYAGLVYFHLLLANLADRGLLDERETD